MVGVSLASLGTHTTAGAALPVVTLEHSQPPRLVLRRAVASLVGIRPVVAPADLVIRTSGLDELDSLWHGSP
jgi:hypothetical protein